MIEDIELQKTEPAAFDDELSDEALDRAVPSCLCQCGWKYCNRGVDVVPSSRRRA